MNKFLLIISTILLSVNGLTQELNGTVVVNAEQTGKSDLQVFKTLERDLTEFINDTKWTGMTFAPLERIEYNMVLLISEYESDTFNGSLQIQASRPVFGSTYRSPIYNFNDRQFSFNYREFQPLNFNPNVFESNLVSIIAFHVYTILGLDASTFEKNGGDEHFNTAKQIVNTAASGNFQGWKASDGNQSRFQLNDALISPAFKEFHVAMYDYHRNGLDVMQQSPKDGKMNIAIALNTLKEVNDRRPNSFLLRTFFDAKAQEIQDVYSGGPSIAIDELVDNLNRMAPTKRDNWKEIKF